MGIEGMYSGVYTFVTGSKPKKWGSQPLKNIESAEGWVDKFFGTTPDDAKGVKSCIPKYIPSHYTYKLFYLIYRIKQTCLAIFGYSDWQKARKEVIHLIHDASINKEFDVTQLKNSSEQKFFADLVLRKLKEFYLANSNSEEQNFYYSYLKEINADFREKYKKDPSVQIIKGWG